MPFRNPILVVLAFGLSGCEASSLTLKEFVNQYYELFCSYNLAGCGEGAPPEGMTLEECIDDVSGEQWRDPEDPEDLAAMEAACPEFDGDEAASCLASLRTRFEEDGCDAPVWPDQAEDVPECEGICFDAMDG